MIGHASIYSQLGIGFDPDYINILTRGNTLGYDLPSLIRREAENEKMVKMKEAFGVTPNTISNISSLPILQWLPFATDGDSDFATISWREPTNSARQAIKVNSPSFTALSGFNSNGTSSYLRAGVHVNEYTQNNFSIASRQYINIAEGNSFHYGASQSSGFAGSYLFLNSRNGINQRVIRVSDTSNWSFTSITNATLRHIIARDGDTRFLSLNGANFSSDSQTFSQITADREIFLLSNNSSVGNEGFSTRGINYFILFTRKITNTEAANIDTALVNYLS
jgi:hypothetical protein